MKTEKIKQYEIAITMIPLVGPVIARQLITFCGSVEAVFTEQNVFLNLFRVSERKSLPRFRMQVLYLLLLLKN